MTRNRHRERLALVAPLVLAGLACGEDSGSNSQPNTTPAALTIVSGDNQSGTVGQTLSSALVVRVTNSEGAALSGVDVAWSAVTGGGAVTSPATSTNAQGEAATAYTLGAMVGTNEVRAAVTDMTNLNATFTATGTTAPPPPPPPPPPAASVSVEDNFYAANNVTINAGENVKWTWNGFNPHTVTLDPPRNDESGIQSAGTFMVKFSNPGTFTYFCSVHGRAIMSGQVVVN